MSSTPPSPTILTGASRSALDLGNGGHSCSEAVLCACGPLLGLPPSLARKVASGLAGGMGLSGRTCGAVTASLLVLGLLLGPDDPQDGYGRHRSLLACADFLDCFEQRHGSLDCRILCPGASLATPEGAKALRQSGIPQKLIHSAVEIVEDMAEADR